MLAGLSRINEWKIANVHGALRGEYLAVPEGTSHHGRGDERQSGGRARDRKRDSIDRDGARGIDGGQGGAWKKLMAGSIGLRRGEPARLGLWCRPEPGR